MLTLTTLLPGTARPNEQALIDRHIGRARLISRGGWWLIAAFLVPMLAWLAWAPLASAVVAHGVVKVDNNRAVVQHVEGGTVRAVLVRDGQQVKAGDPLIELGDVGVQAEERRLLQRLRAEKAGLARLEAEQARRTTLVYPPDLVEAAATDDSLREQMAKEQDLFQARLTTLSSSLGLYARQRETILREIEALRGSVRSAEESIGVQSRELEMNRRLAKEGLVSDSQVMQLESRIADYRGRIAQFNADLTRADQRIGETEMRSTMMRNDYVQQASDQLKLAMVRVGEIEQELRKARDASKRQVIKAPVDGEVIGLKVTTPGAVLMPRDTLAEIVPRNPKLLVHAQITPEDISRVHKGERADLRFTSFRYRTTDMAQGTVTYVGADRLVQHENGMPYYLIHVDVDLDSVKRSVHDGSPADIQAGMPVDVHVRGENRSALKYMFEPITTLMWRAGRER